MITSGKLCKFGIEDGVAADARNLASAEAFVKMAFAALIETHL